MHDLHARFGAAQASAESIFWRPASTPAAMFGELAAFAEEHAIEWDRYGERGAVAQLESEVAELLGKGLGGTSGALVVCPEDLAGELRSWRARMGGTIFSMTTAAVGGLIGLREHVTKFGDYRAWAIALAAALNGHGLRTFPEVPHIATFLAYAPGTADEVNERVVASTEERGVVPCGLWRDTDVPGWVETELTCYESALVRDPAEVAGLMAAAVGF